MGSLCRWEFAAGSRNSEKGVAGLHPRRNPKDLPQIHPALQVSGWRTPTLSGSIARSHDIGLATAWFAYAITETELIPSGRPLL